jgi:hypothetical protein
MRGIALAIASRLTNYMQCRSSNHSRLQLPW